MYEITGESTPTSAQGLDVSINDKTSGVITIEQLVFDNLGEHEITLKVSSTIDGNDITSEVTYKVLVVNQCTLTELPGWNVFDEPMYYNFYVIDAHDNLVLRTINDPG